jgi:hypothetical protein
VVVVVVEVPAEVQVACAGGGSRGGRQDDGRGVHRAFILLPLPLPLPLHLFPNLPSVESIVGIEGKTKFSGDGFGWSEKLDDAGRPARRDASRHGWCGKAAELMIFASFSVLPSNPNPIRSNL